MDSFYIKRIILYALLSLVIVLFGDILTQHILNTQYALKKHQVVQANLSTLKSELEAQVTHNLLLIHAAATYIALNPSLSQEEFNLLAQEILNSSDYLENVAAAPNFVIQYIYPIQGNEKLVGMSYRDLPGQWEDAYAVKKKGEMVLAGPISLVQGGRGIIGRIPVYTTHENTRVFWGLVSSVIHFDSLMAPVLTHIETLNLKVSIRKVQDVDNHEPIIPGDIHLFQMDDSEKIDIRLPGTHWQLAAIPKGGWGQSPYVPIVHLISLAAFLLFIFLFHTRIKIEKQNYMRMETERELKDKSKALEDAQHLSNIGSWIFDRKTNTMLWSSQLYTIFGVNPNEVTPSFDAKLQCIIPKDRPIYQEYLDKAINQGEAYTLEMEIQTSDSTTKTLMEHCIVEKDQQNVIQRITGTTQDITDQKKANAELERVKNLLELFFTQSLDGFFFMMLDEPIEWSDNEDKEKQLEYVFNHQRITKINDAMLQQYGAERDQFMGLTPADFFEHDMETGKTIWKEFFDEGRLHIDTNERRFDGTEIIIEGDYLCIYDNENRILGHFGVQRDITDKREAQNKLALYIEIVDEHVIISQTDLEGNITYASKSFCEISGYTTEQLLGKNHNIIRHPDMPGSLFKDMWDTILEDKTWYGEIKNRKKDGGYYWVDTYVSPLFSSAGVKYGYMAVRIDITAKKAIEKVSITDPLTQIYNRVKLDESLHQVHHTFEEHGIHYSLILFDIDKFKSINDTYGHLAGDKILQEISALVLEHIRDSDILGRWGGEEFLLICPATQQDEAVILAERLRKQIEMHEFDGVAQVKQVTCSFGVCSTEVDTTHDTLLKLVDDALYEAKHAGRNQVHFA